MTSIWPTAKLGDVIDLFDAQRVPLNSRQRHERQGKYPYYGAQGIIDHIDDYIFDGRYILVAEDGENLNSKKLPLALFANGKFWVNNHAHILRGKPDIADDTFILACLNSADIKPFVTGAAQPKLSQGNLRLIEIPFPPLPIQRRIAGILSAYDELIENSQRRIKILESMARALYREWFVHFRFPGHESVPRVPSPLGEIPQGWEVKKLADFVTTKYGYTESANVMPVGPKYLRGMDMNKTSFIDWSQVPYCPIPKEDHEAYRLKVGDVLVIRMADPGKVGIVEQEVDAVFASYLIRVAPKDERLSPYFLFYLMESTEYYAYITGASTGTTRKSASAGVIADYQFAVPPQGLADQFERRAREFRSLLTTLLKQVVNLRRTRDLLLPRLLSGQIDVESLQ